jgi:hypothetical protein
VNTRPLPREIRIVSGGGPFETRILDAETGEDLSDRISAVYWQHIAGEMPRAIVTFKPAAAEIRASIICSLCGKPA